MKDEKLMKIAKKRVQAKQALRFQAILFTFVSIMLVGLYFLINSFLDKNVFFWPIIPIAGMAFALLIQWIVMFTFLFGSGKSTEKAIQAEYERLKKQNWKLNEMKKILKRVLIITGSIIAVLVLAFAGIALKLKYEMKEFAPMETGRLVDNVFVVKDDYQTAVRKN